MMLARDNESAASVARLMFTTKTSDNFTRYKVPSNTRCIVFFVFTNWALKYREFSCSNHPHTHFET